MSNSGNGEEMTLLRALSSQYPTASAAISELAALSASLQFPKGAVHIVSDVHGEYKKLRHIINNASGHLRPMVADVFKNRLDETEQRELMALLYYPRESMEHLSERLDNSEERRQWVRKTLRMQFEIIRALAKDYRREHVESLLPVEFHELFEELISEPSSGRGTGFVDVMLESMASHDRDLAAIRAASRLIRNLSVAEIIVAGDLGDRGPRIDRVIEYLMRQPRVAIAWGNHDVSWMGACLGQEALIATVVRISLRYRRLSQLEEGYGLIMAPLEKLVRDVYADDPATHFKTKGTGLRDDLLMARMQKAISIIQFKLEGQIIERHPEWRMQERNILPGIDTKAGTVRIGEKVYPLRDSNFPTLDPAKPNQLSAAEETCMKRLRESFVSSPRLWQHMSFVVHQGAIWLRRDHAVIFHGCVAVDEDGSGQSLVVDGKEQKGRALFDALDLVVRRAFRKGSSASESDKDWLWYLWTGATSPLFGKDRMATFESYFLEDKEAKKEHKNAYFRLLHDGAFCGRLAAEFGVAEDGLIVNGHCPVKVEKGEEPVKKGGNAITIDGGFSEAYGDRGYTLVLASGGVALAEHHHFESVTEAITSGSDIIPKIMTIRKYDAPRRVADTEDGATIRQTINALQLLIAAYDEGRLPEQGRA
jgi:fructose-1,6-bisphosphatase-3